MNAQITKSFSGSGRRYLVGQAKLKNGLLHAQFAGEEGNRPYGAAANFETPHTAVDNFFANAKNQSRLSLATKTSGYVALQVSPNYYGNIHIQAMGVGGNRNYGLSFDVATTSSFYDWLVKTLNAPVNAPVKQEAVPASKKLTFIDTSDMDEDEEDEDADEQTAGIGTNASIVEKLQTVLALVDEIRAALKDL